MKFPKIFVLLLLLKVISTDAQSDWLNSKLEALLTSKIENKPILLIYHSEMSPNDVEMELNVWGKKDIFELKKNFVSLKLERERTRSYKGRYSKDSVGTIYFLDSWGNKLYETHRYKNKIAVKDLLKQFSINMSNINAAMTILEKDLSNENSNIRVAEKFQDKVPYLEGEAKKIFVLRSNFYLNEGSQLIPKKNKVLSERAVLVKLINKVYFGGAKKVLKKVNKNFPNVNESNQPLFNYLKFLCYNSIGDFKNRDKVYKELIQNNNHNYITKADVIIERN